MNRNKVVKTTQKYQITQLRNPAPAAGHYTPEAQPVLRLLRELGTRPPVRRLVVDKPGFRLSLSGSSGEPGVV